MFYITDTLTYTCTTSMKTTKRSEHIRKERKQTSHRRRSARLQQQESAAKRANDNRSTRASSTDALPKKRSGGSIIKAKRIKETQTHRDRKGRQIKRAKGMKSAGKITDARESTKRIRKRTFKGTSASSTTGTEEGKKIAQDRSQDDKGGEETETTQTDNGSLWKHVSTLTGDDSQGQNQCHLSADKVRYTSVVFLDGDHVLAVNDMTNYEVPNGCRVCCFRLDGTLVAEVRLPGAPWTVIALSPTEAVVTLRHGGAVEDTPTGLVWLAIDIKRGALEIVKTIQLKQDCFGIAYDKSDDVFVVSHFKENFMSILNRDGVRIGKIPIPKGYRYNYRCIIVGQDILYLEHTCNKVNLVNRRGKEKLSLPQLMLRSPVDLERGISGNIFVANFASGNVCQYDANGNYVTTVISVSQNDLCGIALNETSDTMAVAHGKRIGIYKLQH